MPRLVTFTEDRIPELMWWFPERGACQDWGGPHFRYPFTAATFLEDLRLSDSSSYALVENGGELLGFGQYYLRTGRCHLARLATSPGHRRRGLGGILIRELCRRGCERLAADTCSLFVMADNAPALGLYRKLGFETERYTGGDLDLDFDRVLYLAAPLAKVLS